MEKIVYWVIVKDEKHVYYQEFWDDYHKAFVDWWVKCKEAKDRSKLTEEKDAVISASIRSIIGDSEIDPLTDREPRENKIYERLFNQGYEI